MKDENANELQSIAVVTAAGGVRIDAAIRGHTVHTDQPVHAGGADSAVMPLELLAASLGTCVALYAHQFCAKRGIDDDGLRVEVLWEKAEAPRRIRRFDVQVTIPDAVPEHYRPALERAVRTCPVHNTLAHAPEMNIELLTTVPV
jgi:putative redox protein